MNIKNVIFYNWGHYGDIHFSRNFIKDICKKLNTGAIYQNNVNKKIFNDIQSVNFLNFNLFNYIEDELLYNEVNETVLINTWIGSSGRKYLLNGACCLSGNYEKYKIIYKNLNIQIEEPLFYIPDIDFNFYNVKNIDDFIFKNLNRKKILICNGDVRSGQAKNFDMNILLNHLSKKYKDHLFLVTDNSNKIIEKNITYTADINKIFDNDLNEIAYLSTYCDTIIGRGSGPYCCSNIKTNLLNKNKNFIGFTNLYGDSHWANNVENNLNGANQIWDNSFNFDKMIELIENKLN